MATIRGFLHLEKGQVAVIELPANCKSKRERTQASYLMAGLASLMSTGDASFTDEQARALCLHFGCYDRGNYRTFVNGLGNKVTGSKSTGWKLTAPGLGEVAELIKSQASPNALCFYAIGGPAGLAPKRVDRMSSKDRPQLRRAKMGASRVERGQAV
jgi:hypothetical protein